MRALYCVATAAVAGIVIVGCTVHETPAPALTGPSQSAQTLTVTATPDTITQNGSSQSIVAMTVVGPNGNPVPNVSLRVDTMVGGTVTTFGSLSAKTVVTGSNGTATVIYTAPPSPPNGAVVGSCSPNNNFTPALPGSCVTIAATPISNGFTNGTSTWTVDIHLVPVDVIPVPGAPTPDFTFTQGANGEITFNGSPSLAASGKTIVDYTWDFGDGSHTKSGVNTTHDYAAVGTYFVTLTVTDNTGVRASVTKSVTAVTAVP